MLLSVAVLLVGAALGFVATWSLFPIEETREPSRRGFGPSIVLGKHQFVVRCLAFSPDGKTLATGGGFSDVPGEIKLWDLGTGTEQATFRGEQRAVHGLEFSPDGRLLATTSLDNVVTFWDVSSGRELARTSAWLPRTLGTVLAPDGGTLAVARLGPDSSSIRLWNVAAEKEHPLLGGSGPVRFSADGRRLALWRISTEGENAAANSAFAQGLIPTNTAGAVPVPQVWDIPLGRETMILRGHECYVWALAFSPDGRTLASGGFDNTIKTWEVRTGREQLTLRGHTDQVGALAYAPDGELLASGSHDKTVRLWDAVSGRDLAALTGHTGTITCLAFAPDGRSIASSGHDRTVRLWPVEVR
jgi:WD40 repeat protein